MLPVRGATMMPRSVARLRVDFNPCSPCGERPPSYATGAEASPNFNPCSPCGERLVDKRRDAALIRISIHAPRAGSDCGSPNQLNFNDISIHAPRAGSDCNPAARPSRSTRISIHAPRAGSDPNGCAPTGTTPNFNPCSPCGERRVLSSPSE